MLFDFDSNIFEFHKSSIPSIIISRTIFFYVYTSTKSFLIFRIPFYQCFDIELIMKPLFETSLKFPNNVVITKPIAVQDRHTNSCVKALHVKITSNSEVVIPLTSLKAEKFGIIDLKFFGVPIEVRQKGRVLLYGIFNGDYLNEIITDQTNSELIGIPQQKFVTCRIKSNLDTFISPIHLGAPLIFPEAVITTNNYS